MATSPVDLRWDAEARLLHVRLKPGITLTAHDARAAMQVVDAMAGPEPFRILVDTTGVDDVNVAWRTAWAPWFHAHRERVRVAVFPSGPLDRATIPAFSFMTGVEIRAFPHEAAALAWLRGAPQATRGNHP